ncbi:prolyl oligopeptidase family serine peptidase [Pseudoxanthomonas sp. GW2]|uniref:carboxylesterase family protein n=1 Tax=Pseudoxanthomonas sp. GW2 TaxID=1211114 RepID=UPI0002E94FDC|nr:prolyl oligopeptidase family serine peptidase [Pseudoxanthomonas sp. GW2]
MHPYRLLWLLVLLACLPVSACQTPPSLPDTGGFVQRELEFEGRVHRYAVFVPAAARRGGPLPVVLFLHGSGERGEDGQAQTTAGLGPYLRRHAGTFPALVVMPQVRRGEEWTGANARMALAALDAASAEFGGDPARTYATGMSMGGYGTWEVALLAPDRFAALVPVCAGVLAPRAVRPTLYVTPVAGEPDPHAALVQRLRHLPVWMFHGARDDVVLPHDTRRVYQLARQAGADFRYTEYPEGNHNAWDATYADPAMWDWLFAQRLPPDRTPP